MNRYKKLIGNSIIFAIGNLGSKLMQFIMVPLYSYTMTTSQFGQTDIITTVISLLAPVVSLEVFDAVFRFAMDKQANQARLLTTGMTITSITSILTGVIGLILQRLWPQEYFFLGALILISTIFYSFISNYVRAIGYSKRFAVAGMVNTFFMVVLNVILLAVLHLGIVGYFVSLLVGLSSAILFLLLTTKELLVGLNLTKYDHKVARSMIIYGLPLIPNALSWWLNSASDRMFILALVGYSANGLYAMANKIPNALSVVTNIFFQSWQISAVEEYNSKDADFFISRILTFFMYVLFIGSLVILIIVKPIFRLMIDPSYFTAWRVTPFILLSLIYSSLSGFLGTIYTATKRTGPIFLTTFYGAIINVIASYFFIKAFGIYGAALANVTSFLVVMFLRYRQIKSDGKIHLRWFDILACHLAYLTYSIVLLAFSNDLIVYGLGLLIILVMVVINWSKIKPFISGELSN